MDLSALLAREGIGPGDVETLLQWARQRAPALIARIEPGSPLAELLGGHERTQAPGAAAPEPVVRSVPRPIARSVSRPHLNAAVEAALSGMRDIELAIENSPAADQALPERPVLEDIPEPAPEPAPEPPEDDPSIGGFNRFAFALRKRAPEPAPEPVPPRTGNLTRGFELHAESQGPRRSWDDEHVPEPPGFEARLSESASMHIASLDAESSDGLVLGIPDDDGDIPVYRGRARSQAIAAETSSSGLTDAAFDAMIEPSDLAPVAPEPHATEHVASAPHAAARAASGPAPAASGPHAAARAASGPVPAASGPMPAARLASGPMQAAARPSSGATAREPATVTEPTAEAAIPTSRPALASTPTRAAPPPNRRGKKTQPQPIVAAAKPAKPEPRHEGKKGKQRKKVVELSQPVARPVSAASPAAPAARPATLPPVSLTRPISAANAMATATPASPGVPDYLRDDED